MFNPNIPLWYQLAELLRARISTGDLPLGTRLPTERRLAEQYGVSLITVRQALASLAGDSMIRRQRGRGTFVTAKPASRHELKLVGSADDVIDQQMSEETEILERSEVAVPADLVPMFPGRKRVTFFRRLRREEGVPLSYALDYTLPEVAAKVKPGLLRRYPMLKIFRDAAGIPLGGIKLTVGAVVATAEIAEHLGIEISSPALRLVGVASDDAGRVVGVAQIYYRADRFRFTIDIDVRGKRAAGAKRRTKSWALAEIAMPEPLAIV